jgi:hypothetical protein
MAILTNEQKQIFRPVINIFAAIVIICVMVTLVCNLLIGHWPPYVEWLQPVSNLVLILGAIIAGAIIADRNKLVK